jgi:hypothetical protein
MLLERSLGRSRESALDHLVWLESGCVRVGDLHQQASGPLQGPLTGTHKTPHTLQTSKKRE